MVNKSIRDSWRLLLLLVAIISGLLVVDWQLGVDFSAVLAERRILHSLIVAFTTTSGVLFMATVAMAHRHSRVVEQLIGTGIATGFGILLYGVVVSDLAWTVPYTQNGVDDQFYLTALRMLGTLLAAFTAFGLVFGMLLALVTGRQPEKDPLLDLESQSFADEDDSTA
jgi:hypothetical protein